MDQNYFDILNISPNKLDAESLESAYSKRKKEVLYEALADYGLESNKLLKPNMNLIEEAYLVLKNPTKRKDYEKQTDQSRKIKIKNEIKKHLYPEYIVDLDFEEIIKEQTNFDGPFLRKIRQYRKIDLSQMEKLSKVATRHLKSIEEDNYMELPASVYLRGFLINYARVLDLDEEKVSQSYMKSFYEQRGH